MPAAIGAVGAAAIGAGAGIYEQGQAGKAADKANAPLRGAQNALYSQAQSIAATPYTAYEGNQVADLSGNQVKAVQQAGANSGPYSEAQQYLTSAGDQAADIAGNNWNAATAAKYANPYQQNVTDIALRKENQSYTDAQNANDANSAASGAFGGDRAALTKAATSAGHNLNQGDIQAQGSEAGYKNAQQLWVADNARHAAAADAYRGAGNDITNMNSSQIKDLLATGGADQAVKQMKLTTDYNNYLDKRDWAANQLKPLESAVGRTPTAALAAPTSYASSLIGAGSALAGYFGSHSGSSSSTNSGGGNDDGIGGGYGTGAGSALNDNNYFTAGSTGSSTGGYGIDGTGYIGGSDRRIKWGIKALGMSDNGLMLYRFRYLSSRRTFLGYMADEVQKLYPAAVHALHGFLRVNYGLIPDGVFREIV